MCFGVPPISDERRRPRAPRGAYLEHLSNTSSTQVLDCSNTSSCRSNSRPYPGNPVLTLERDPCCRPRDWRREGRIAVLTVWVRAVGKVRVPSRPTSRAKKVGLQGLPWTRKHITIAEAVAQGGLATWTPKMSPKGTGWHTILTRDSSLNAGDTPL